jgi:GTP-binding protein HflX
VHEIKKDEKPERVLLVGTARTPSGRWDAADRLDELGLLSETAGAQVFEKMLQIRNRPDPAYYVGKGKAQELKAIAHEFEVDSLVFDAPLSPSQNKNLQDLTGLKVVDRNELIMDIFAQHAKTAEAKIQVELAQLNYRLPRLRGRGIELSRLGGGIGTRGPGEQKLEVDRRRIGERIAMLKRTLEKIEKSKKIQRKRRQNVLKLSLVGYTNTGKSSLMNVLTKSKVRVEDKLFATLDATTRVFPIPGLGARTLLSDTVGFIEDLPPELVASFRATLGVVREADLLLHVIDVSHPRNLERIHIVDQVLEDIECQDIPVVRVFNKTDLLVNQAVVERTASKFPGSAFISARTRKGVAGLKRTIEERIRTILREKYEGTHRYTHL